MVTERRVIVIGAGAAGLMAAGRAAELGARVLLLEKTDGPGKKILVSGKTRCNLTNTRPLDQFIAMFGANGRFLHGPFRRFFREETIAFFRCHGVETKEERGGRVFPASDDAHDVVHALWRHCEDGGVRLITGARVTAIEAAQGRVLGVREGGTLHRAEAVVLAAGGASWPGTGSTGDGYKMAAALGHTIVPLRPALVPLAVYEVDRAKSMQGVSLRNVRLTALSLPVEAVERRLLPDRDVGGRGEGGKRPRPPVIESRLGEMLITHFGIGGPITLLMSLAVAEARERGPVSVAIDLKPGLTEEQLRQRLLRDMAEHGKRSYRALLRDLLPQKMIEPLAALTEVPLDKPLHQVTAAERERLLDCLKCLRFGIERPLPLSRAIVTAGGVALGEIDPRDLSSRLVAGLHFAGEVMDLDADTGGYNLQAAFTTGYLAGEAAARG